jgi:hypothetical protein
MIKPGSKSVAKSSGTPGNKECVDGWAKDILEQRALNLMYRPEGP